MNTIETKIFELLEETKKLLAIKKYEEARKHLETILILDSNNAEAKYVLDKIKDLNTSVITNPNVRFERPARYTGSAINYKIFIDDIEVLSIPNGYWYLYTVQVGVHKLSVKAWGMRTVETEFEIINENTMLTIIVGPKSAFSTQIVVQII